MFTFHRFQLYHVRLDITAKHVVHFRYTFYAFILHCCSGTIATSDRYALCTIAASSLSLPVRCCTAASSAEVVVGVVGDSSSNCLAPSSDEAVAPSGRNGAAMLGAASEWWLLCTWLEKACCARHHVVSTGQCTALQRAGAQGAHHTRLHGA